jgi:hypothetical protein
MIRKTNLFLALPAVLGLLATSPAYAYWHRGFVGHGGWGRPGVGVGVGLGVAAGAAVGLAAGAALAAPRYVAPAPVSLWPRHPSPMCRRRPTTHRHRSPTCRKTEPNRRAHTGVTG